MNYKCPVHCSLQIAFIFKKQPKYLNVRSPPEHSSIGNVHSDI